MSSISDYTSMSNKRLAELIEQIGQSQEHDHRGVLLLEAARRLREQGGDDAIKAKVREAMAEIGTSSLGHHKLREIVGWPLGDQGKVTDDDGTTTEGSGS